jgi:hypothetical protein
MVMSNLANWDMDSLGYVGAFIGEDPNLGLQAFIQSDEVQKRLADTYYASTKPTLASFPLTDDEWTELINKQEINCYFHGAEVAWGVVPDGTERPYLFAAVEVKEGLNA